MGAVSPLEIASARSPSLPPSWAEPVGFDDGSGLSASSLGALGVSDAVGRFVGSERAGSTPHAVSVTATSARPATNASTRATEGLVGRGEWVIRHLVDSGGG